MGAVSLQDTRSLCKHQLYFYASAMSNSKNKLGQFCSQQNQNQPHHVSVQKPPVIPLHTQGKIPMCSSHLTRLSNDLTPVISLSSPRSTMPLVLSVSVPLVTSVHQVWQVCCLELLLLRWLPFCCALFAQMSESQRGGFLITNVKLFSFLHPHCSLFPYFAVHKRTHMHTLFVYYPTVFHLKIFKFMEKLQEQSFDTLYCSPGFACFSVPFPRRRSFLNMITIKSITLKNYIDPMLLFNQKSIFKLFSSNNLIYRYFFLQDLTTSYYTTSYYISLVTFNLKQFPTFLLSFMLLTILKNIR